MRAVRVFHYDSFTTIPNKGNPAGVVLEADHLSTDFELHQDGGLMS